MKRPVILGHPGFTNRSIFAKTKHVSIRVSILEKRDGPDLEKRDQREMHQT